MYSAFLLGVKVAMAHRSIMRHRLPRLYHDANSSRSKDYYDCERLKIQWGKLDDYEVVRKIGRGKYSEVFEGFHIITDKSCVIKVLKPVKKKKNQKRGKNIAELGRPP